MVVWLMRSYLDFGYIWAVDQQMTKVCVAAPALIKRLWCVKRV